ncbi:MAG: calcium/sodium antiporter [Alphaproteobacteria bacterium]|nr:calcium/sodium antiporter [Alphaproteobacteria bacterium]MDA7982445.1 calcium/sodium antiporter [Alphaproteobacteria bacterium]MDA7983396.1 calcium/sodium antiporter [Alphaproteobacteria bacterium]MDA7988407.1 calcium/sodium antiporter [Alphaproteobacteria bacterium]MDA8008763.1 calcium/sodium antiporter [Alphaproteobacteria bacterium]
MSAVVPLILVAIGLFLLFSASDLLIRAAVALARHFSLSPAIIGVVLVGFGTSLPELVTSVQAAMVGSFGIAVGNVFGSSIANILGILALALVLCPLARVEALRRSVLVLLIATMAVMLLTLWGEIGRLHGLLLFAALCFYLWYEVGEARRRDLPGDPPPPTAVHIPEPFRPWAEKYVWVHWWFRTDLPPTAARAAVGLVGVAFGAQVLVSGAISTAGLLGVSEALIGVTLVAVGTSLPELATILAAARRRQGEIIAGNIVGSNIFNLLGILGVASLARPMIIPERIVSFDLWVLVLATLLLVWGLLLRESVGRVAGIIFLVIYFVYIFVRIFFVG